LANIKSAIKSIRKDAKRTARNRPVKAALKTYIKNAVAEIRTQDETPSIEAVRVASSKLDKAARKGIIHPRQAARRKSRLMAKFNSQFAEKAQA
jgi:small subunit ribosomal protein S20